MNWRIWFLVYVMLLTFMFIFLYDWLTGYIVALSLVGSVAIGYWSGQKGD